MKFVFLLLMVLPLLSPMPDEVIKANRLTIIDTDLVHDTTFNAMDLVTLMNQPKTASLRLRMVTCPIPHTPPDAVDEMPEVEGFQHMAVFSSNGAGDLLKDEAKVALPCPPHCGGEKKLLVTLAYFREYYE